MDQPTVLEGDLVEAVSRLKKEQDGTIAVHGSRQLAQTLLDTTWWTSFR